MDKTDLSYYINSMDLPPTWDESKRQANLVKHGLDFTQSHLVLNSEIRVDISVMRQGE